MYTLIIALITIFIILAVIRVVVVFSDKIKFFTAGLDSGFKVSEIILLWQLAKLSDLEESSSLFWSVPALNRSIAAIIEDANKNGKSTDKQTQNFLEKLYKYRTKVELSPDNKFRMKSTKLLARGQKLRIILRGKGVFNASIINNGRDLVISMPMQNNQIVLAGYEWIGKHISVYFWRKNDAGYVFDTVVKDANQFNGRNSICLEHTEHLIRTQKRRSVRCACSIYGQMYFQMSETHDYTAPEPEPGFKCLIEDISEDGALIRIGGKGKSNIQIKIQFPINDKIVIMFGTIKCVEYNKEKNQSRLHFECLKIEQEDRNIILAYVYNLVPQEQKEVLDAIRLTEEDQLVNSDKNNQNVQENTDPYEEL